MKKFYILFFAIPVLAFTLLYLNIWWFIGAMAGCMIFIAYRFFAERLQAAEDRKEVLEKDLEDLHIHLENAVLKEQKASREAEQIRQLKQQLLSVISHEVRTPMNGVMGMTLLLGDTPLTKEQEEYVNTIRICGENLLTTVNNMLVNDILDFSKLQKEGNQLEYKDFELRDSIEEVIEMFAEKTGKTGVDLLYSIDEEVPAQIIGDSKRLRQVLMNLIENAAKFTNKGEIFVSVHYTLHTMAGHPPELNFEIRDTGIGIDKDQLKQLFNGIPGKELQKDKNTGLGLVICKKLVELMGGTIEAKSEPGEGTVINFNIPLTPSLRSVRGHARQNEMSNLQDKLVLVVDDNWTSRNVLVKQLKLWKMAPISADSAEQALDILAKNDKINLVITDINMPGMNGIELAQTIQETYTSIPVMGLNLTGNTRYRDHQGLFYAIVNKPVRQAFLRDKLLGVFAQSVAINQNTDTMSELFANQYPLRILIAEDNPINQKIATKILTKLGYTPEVANNGKEVMEIVSNEHFDIILMDVQMPEMDGLEASRMIRTCLEIQPVIIAVTANAMQGDRDECMQAGMDDYMSKPIELKELLSQLEKWALALRERRRATA